MPTGWLKKAKEGDTGLTRSAEDYQTRVAKFMLLVNRLFFVRQTGVRQCPQVLMNKWGPRHRLL